ncbi:2304_t:CDS:2 [Entrophospora sp. SA101]|nr:2304_t:CDS:2 [Entrophospora sp. SA101]
MYPIATTRTAKTNNTPPTTPTISPTFEEGAAEGDPPLTLISHRAPFLHLSLITSKKKNVPAFVISNVDCVLVSDNVAESNLNIVNIVNIVRK